MMHGQENIKIYGKSLFISDFTRQVVTRTLSKINKRNSVC